MYHNDPKFLDRQVGAFSLQLLDTLLYGHIV